MLHELKILTAAGTAFLVLGCVDNPVAVEDDHDETLTAELSLSSEHVHTLSEVVFTVVVRNDHGDAVTDLEGVTVDRRAEGDDTWRSTELELDGTVWRGVYTFNSSGEYELRVSLTRHGGHDAEIVHHMDEHLHVGRAHLEVGAFRVEFESFPGHLHEGDVAEMRFWVFEAEANTEGVRPPVTGLNTHIECREGAETSEEHNALEVEAGVYMATHTFGEAGDFTAVLHLPDGDAGFLTHVSHGH